MVRSGGLLWDGKTNGEAAIVLKKGEIPNLRFSSSRKLWRGVQGQTSCTLGKGERRKLGVVVVAYDCCLQQVRAYVVITYQLYTTIGASLSFATQHGWATELAAGPGLRLVVSYKPAAVTVLPALTAPPVQRSWDAKLKFGGAVLIEVSANRTIRFGRSKVSTRVCLACVCVADVNILSLFLIICTQMRVGFCWGFGGDLSAVIRLSRGSMRVHIPIRVGRFGDPIGVLLSLGIPQTLDSFISWGVSQFGFNHYEYKTNEWYGYI